MREARRLIQQERDQSNTDILPVRRAGCTSLSPATHPNDVGQRVTSPLAALVTSPYSALSRSRFASLNEQSDLRQVTLPQAMAGAGLCKCTS